jgi:maleylacetoacetate isomerase
MASPLKLYSYWRSTASYRARLALAYKGLAYEYVPVHLMKDGGQQNTPAYRALNPNGRVPLLVDGDFKLSQSIAIFDYLDSRWPAPRLFPVEPKARARTLSMCLLMAADIQPLHNLSTFQYLAQAGWDQAARDAWGRHWVERGLTAVVAELEGVPESACLLGEEPGAADCILVPQLYAAPRYGTDVAKQFPRLARVAERLLARPDFASAHPDRQPDATPG